MDVTHRLSRVMTIITKLYLLSIKVPSGCLHVLLSAVAVFGGGSSYNPSPSVSGSPFGLARFIIDVQSFGILKQNESPSVLIFSSVFIYPTCVLFSWSVHPSPAFQGRRAITPNERPFLARVPLKIVQECAWMLTFQCIFVMACHP